MTAIRSPLTAARRSARTRASSRSGSTKPDHRATEVGEHRGHAVGVQRSREQPLPAGDRLGQAPLALGPVLAREREQSLHARQARHERLGKVARRHRLEHRGAQLFAPRSSSRARISASASASRVSGRLIGAPSTSDSASSRAASASSPDSSATTARSCFAIATSSGCSSSSASLVSQSAAARASSMRPERRSTNARADVQVDLGALQSLSRDRVKAARR